MPEFKNKKRTGFVLLLLFLVFIFGRTLLYAQEKNPAFQAGDIAKITDICSKDSFFDDYPVGMILEIKEVKKNRFMKGDWFMVEGIVQEKFNGRIYKNEKAWQKGEWVFFNCVKIEKINPVNEINKNNPSTTLGVVFL